MPEEFEIFRSGIFGGKYFYGCLDLRRDFGGYSTQSDNCCSTMRVCWLHISA